MTHARQPQILQGIRFASSVRRSSLLLSDNRLTTVVGIRIFPGSLYSPKVGVSLSKEASDTNRTHGQSSLAGMIHKVGLLPPDNRQQVPFAYKMYTRTDTTGWDQSNAFKQAFSLNVKIEFLGVWCVIAVHVILVSEY